MAGSQAPPVQTIVHDQQLESLFFKQLSVLHRHSGEKPELSSSAVALPVQRNVILLVLAGNSGWMGRSEPELQAAVAIKR